MGQAIVTGGPAGGAPPAVHDTGPGPRYPMGLPKHYHGAPPPAQPPPPLSAAGALSTTHLPGPQLMGQEILPRSVGPVVTPTGF
jgi:hypothetical protein